MIFSLSVHLDFVTLMESIPLSISKQQPVITLDLKNLYWDQDKVTFILSAMASKLSMAGLTSS